METKRFARISLQLCRYSINPFYFILYYFFPFFLLFSLNKSPFT